MACRSRSLITCGVAVAAVIAWRCRGSVRTDADCRIPRRGGGGKSADTHTTEGWVSVEVGIMFYDASIFVFASRCDLFDDSYKKNTKSSPGIGYPPPRLVASSPLALSSGFLCSAREEHYGRVLRSRRQQTSWRQLTSRLFTVITHMNGTTG